ncbi:c-di-GMP phosphodiesterase [Gammaproteobacteria bacterium]
MSTESPQHQIFLGRQPILDRSQNIVAYELLFRSGQVSSANVNDDVQATANVIVRAFSELGVSNVLGKHKGFVNVSVDLLLSDIIELLPKEKVVIELLENIEITQEVVNRCKYLKKIGFTLALDDYVVSDPQYLPLVGLIEIVKIDYLLIKKEDLPDIVKSLRKWRVKLLAEKIDDRSQANECLALGFDLFQGYFFAKPVILTGKRTDPSKLDLLQLLGMVLGDADTVEISKMFKRDPSLIYKLLQLVNSVAVGLPRKIKSLNQAISVLGRKQLQRWLQLLLFVQNDKNTNNPLLQLAAMRGKLMESLAEIQAPRDQDYHERAFITGILSLLDVLMGIPIQEILKEINIAPDVCTALTLHVGILSDLLELAQTIECGDFEKAGALLETSGLTVEDLLHAEMNAMRWANELTDQ